MKRESAHGVIPRRPERMGVSRMSVLGIGASGIGVSSMGVDETSNSIDRLEPTIEEDGLGVREHVTRNKGSNVAPQQGSKVSAALAVYSHNAANGKATAPLLFCDPGD